MATSISLTRRVLIAGAFAITVAAAPLVIMAAGHPVGSLPAVAACPAGEIQEPSGACKPAPAPAPFNPLDPEKAQLQPNELTSGKGNNIGQLPQVDGIPCSGNKGGGSGTGSCIGLSESQAQFKPNTQ